MVAEGVKFRSLRVVNMSFEVNFLLGNVVCIENDVLSLASTNFLIN